MNLKPHEPDFVTYLNTALFDGFKSLFAGVQTGVSIFLIPAIGLALDSDVLKHFDQDVQQLSFVIKKDKIFLSPYGWKYDTSKVFINSID